MFKAFITQAQEVIREALTSRKVKNQLKSLNERVYALSSQVSAFSFTEKSKTKGGKKNEVKKVKPVKTPARKTGVTK